MPDHPSWCQPDRCSVGKPHSGEDVRPEVHKRVVAQVDGVTVWVEQAPNGPPVVAVGHHRWAMPTALHVIDALTEAARAIAGARR